MLYKSSLDYDWKTPKFNFELEDISLENIAEIMAVYSFMQLNKITEMSWFDIDWKNINYIILTKFINKFWLLVADKFWDISEKIESDKFIQWVIDYMGNEEKISKK